MMILFIGFILPILLLYNEIDINESVEENIFSNLRFIFISILIYLLIVTVFVTRLKISINQYGIFINFYPFMKRRVAWFKIKKISFVDADYKSVFGINFFTKYDSAYNINAVKGVHFLLKNKKEIVIGVKHTKKLEKVINTYRAVHNFE